MNKTIVLLLLLVLLVSVPAFADSIPSNIEYLDEMDLVYEIGGHDAILGSEQLDVGTMIGISNLGNPWSDEAVGSYAMVKADVKGIKLLNRVFDWMFKK